MVRNLLKPLEENLQTAGFIRPSEAAVVRYCSVPLLFDAAAEVRPVQGEIVYDSWAHGPGVALRDTVNGHVRRLKLKAGRLVFEIVAQRRDNRWEFVARATSARSVTNSFVLKVGGRKLLPQTGGFYIWTSKSVPRLLRLESFEQSVIFEGLAWQ